MNLMTLAEVARHLRVTRETVQRYVRSGAIKATKVGRAYLVAPEDLHAFLRSRS